MTAHRPYRRRLRHPWIQDWRFLLVVAAIALTAFHVTLNRPILIGSDQPSAVFTANQSEIPRRATLECAVASVIDGDTLRCRDGVRIRLHAVAAREADETCSPGHPCPSASALAATRQLRALASGRTIQCQPTGRSYDRVTAICWTPEGVEINCAMIRSGTTVIWERFNRQTPLCHG